MKHTIILLFLLSAFTACSQFIRSNDSLPARTGNHPSQVIKTSPFALIWSQIPYTAELKILYEKSISHNESAMAGISYIYPSPVIRDELKKLEDSLGIDLLSYGFRVQAAQKIFLTRRHFAPKGIYIAPHISYNMIRFFPKGYTDNFLRASFLNASLLAGMQFMMDQVALDIYVGAGYRYNILTSQDGPGTPVTTTNLKEFFPFRNPVKFSLSTNIGWAY